MGVIDFAAVGPLLEAKAKAEGFAPFTTFWGQQQQLGYRWFTDLEVSMPGDNIAKFNGADHGLGLFNDDFARSAEVVSATESFFVEHL